MKYKSDGRFKKRVCDPLWSGMEEKIPVHDIIVRESDLSPTGVTCVANVKYPAIMSNFVALSGLQDIGQDEVLQVNKQRLAKVTGSEGKVYKGLLTGPLLIPDFQIFRMDDDGNPYFIRFSAETIEKIRDKFAKGGWHRNTNDEHAVPLGGNTIVEMWIVEDPEKDKSAALGLTVTKGTLMATMKVEDHEYFQKEILSGNRRGFSIEGWFEYSPAELSEVKQKPKLNMSTKPKDKERQGIFAAFFKALGNVLTLGGSGQKLATYQLEDGTNILVVDETQQVWYLTDDNLQGDAVPDGEHLLADGQTMVVTDGKLTELKPAEEEEETEAAADDAATVDATTETLAKAVGVEAPKLKAALSTAKIGLRDTTKPAKLAIKMQLSAEEKLSILVDTDSKAIYVNPSDGSAWEIGDDLWIQTPLAPGEYTMQDSTKLVVFERTEEYEGWDGETVTVTRSFVNFPESTTAVETLIPWLKETMSAITEATTKVTENLAAITKERDTLKAENAKLKKEPAAVTAAVVPPSTDPKPQPQNKRIAMRDQRVAKVLAAVEKMGA
jgi:hypothetical protein